MRRLTRIILVLLISATMTTLLVLAIQAKSSTPPPQAQGITLPDISTVITKSVGVLASSDGKVTVTFLVNAINEPITATLSFNVTQTIPARFTLIVPRFVIKTQPANGLYAPMTLWVRYTPLPGIKESEMTFVHYDIAANKWQPLPTKVDVTQHTAAAMTSQAGPLALIWRPAVLSLPPDTVIVDDQDTGFIPYGATGWHVVYTSTAGRYWNGSMRWTNNMTHGFTYTENAAKWVPALDPGLYQVYAFIPWDNANTTQARYQIVHNGQTTVFTVNQSSYDAEWASLGTYVFGNETSSNYVLLDDLTYETYFTRIGFDAMGFVPPFKIYLPLVLKNYPPIKSKDGMHLGNRSADWTDDDMLQPIDGTRGGIFPATVVVKSEQLYTIWRGGSLCEIGGIDPQPHAPKLFEYLKKAYSAGTLVIIRIDPSPGNFVDWNDPTQSNHHLLAGNTPAGDTYCKLVPGSETWGFMKYRAVDDIAKEIEQIHNMNKNNGWQEYAFEPANEPNREWYLKQPTGQTAPRIDQSIAWQEMNSYFVALYDAVKALPDGNNIKLLTPSMAQTRYAEPVFVQSASCDPQRLSDNPLSFGYNEMRPTYETKNDGLNWHSYWTYGHESILSYCGGGDGEHISMTFPDWMHDQVMYGSRLVFITEADLADPNMQMGNSLTDKDANTANTRASIQSFFQVEPSLVRPVMWLLNNNFEDLPGEHENADIRWHQAYTPTIGIRPWFTDWWPRPEN